MSLLSSRLKPLLILFNLILLTVADMSPFNFSDISLLSYIFDNIEYANDYELMGIKSHKI